MVRRATMVHTRQNTDFMQLCPTKNITSGLPVSCADLTVSIDADADQEALILEVQALKLHIQEQVRQPL